MAMHKNDPSGTRPGKRVANIALASALSTVLTFGTGAFMAGSAFAAPQSSVNMLAATDAALLPPTDDSNSVTVSTADELWNAIVQSDASVIKIAADIDLNTSTLTGAGDKSPLKNGSRQHVTTKAARDITFESATEGVRYKVDFAGNALNFQGTGTVTFKNLDMFGHTYFGIISNAAKYNLENISYTGAQAIYVQANRTAAIDFYGDIDIKSVDSYVTGIGGSTKSYESQTNGNQAIEADTAVFKAGSNVKMSTVGGHVLQISNSGEGVTLEEGAQVTLEPHMNRNSIEGAPTGTAYALNLQGSKPVNIADGASLNIDLNTVAGDKKLAGAIYISGAGAVNVQDGGRLNVTSNGAWGTGDTSVAIRLAGSGSSINVGKGSTFNFDAQGLGAYTGNIISLGSGASFNANPYSTTTLKADGSGALKLLAVSGGTFTVDQPTLFDVDLTGNSNASARLMNSGSVSVNNSKQHFEDGSYSAPIDTLEIAYTNGNGAVKSVISATQESENKITSEIAGKQKKLTFERAGEALDIVDQSLSLSDDNILTGKVTIDDGLIDTLDVTTDGVPQDVYVNVTVGGRQLTAKVTPNPYWRETGVNYQQLTGADGTFSIDLNEYASALANNATTIAVKATKNFIDDNASVTVGDLRKQNLMYEPAFEESTVTAGESVAVSPTFTKQNTSTPTTPTGAVTYSKADGEEWITVNPNTGEVTANPAADVAPGDYFATVTVTYSDKTVDTVTAKFTVNEVAAPVTKDALNAEIGEEASVKASDAFKNASGEAKDAYEKALADAKAVAEKTDATQAEVDAATKALADAAGALDGAATDKDALAAEIAKEDSVKVSDAYTNATGDAKQKYEEALAAAESVNSDPNATQADVDKALKDLQDATSNLGANDMSGLINAITDANIAKSSDAYKNASDEAKQALDEALKNAEAVRDNPDTTAAEAAAAQKALEEATSKLDGTATDKTALETAIGNANTGKGTDAYMNASDKAKQALDEALAAAEKVNADPNATQAEVDTAKENLENAQKALDGSATDKADLESAITEANESRATDKYINASDEAKQALEEALKAAEEANSNPNATQAEVDAAQEKLAEATANLDGKATDKAKLNESISTADETQKDDKFINASDDAKKAFEDAKKAAEAVRENPRASQEEVDTAQKNLDAAANALDGQATDKDALIAEIGKESTVKAQPGYANGSDEAKAAYDEALEAAKAVAEKTDATQAEVDAAAKALADAANALDGAATNTDALDNAIKAADEAKGTDAYINAGQDKKDAFDEAMKNAEAVKNNPGASQAEVDAAQEALENAQKALDGVDTNKGDLQGVVDNANGAKGTDAYGNASSDAQKAFDDALAAAEKVLSDPNASQADVDAAQKALEQALNGLNGKAAEGVDSADGKAPAEGKAKGNSVGELPFSGANTTWGWAAPFLAAFGAILVAIRKRRGDEE